MKNALFIASLFALAACGLSEDKFEEEFATKLCDAYHLCDEAIDCDAGTTATGTTETTCEFDKTAAKACLDGEFTCDDSAGFPLVDMPADCLDVYDCSGTGTTTETGTTTTETTTATE